MVIISTRPNLHDVTLGTAVTRPRPSGYSVRTLRQLVGHSLVFPLHWESQCRSHHINILVSTPQCRIFPSPSHLSSLYLTKYLAKFSTFTYSHPATPNYKSCRNLGQFSVSYAADGIRSFLICLCAGRIFTWTCVTLPLASPLLSGWRGPKMLHFQSP
jgi:hypothetical protein